MIDIVENLLEPELVSLMRNDEKMLVGRRVSADVLGAQHLRVQ